MLFLISNRLNPQKQRADCRVIVIFRFSIAWASTIILIVQGALYTWDLGLFVVSGIHWETEAGNGEIRFPSIVSLITHVKPVDMKGQLHLLK